MLTVIIVTHLFCCRIHTPVEPSCDVVGLGPVGGAFEVEAMTPRGCRPRGVGPRRECMVSTNTPLLSVYRSAIGERFEVTRPSDELPIFALTPISSIVSYPTSHDRDSRVRQLTNNSARIARLAVTFHERALWISPADDVLSFSWLPFPRLPFICSE